MVVSEPTSTWHIHENKRLFRHKVSLRRTPILATATLLGTNIFESDGISMNNIFATSFRPAVPVNTDDKLTLFWCAQIVKKGKT